MSISGRVLLVWDRAKTATVRKKEKVKIKPQGQQNLLLNSDTENRNLRDPSGNCGRERKVALPTTSGLHICSLNRQSAVGACVHRKLLGCGKGYFLTVSVCLLPTNPAQLCPGPTLSISSL